MTRILVFPGTTNLATEIRRSLSALPNYVLIGAGFDIHDSQTSLYESYHYLPSVDNPDFDDLLAGLISSAEIEIVYPSNDHVIAHLAANPAFSKISILHPRETTEIATDKIQTLLHFKDTELTPEYYESPPISSSLPVFKRFSRAHSSIGAEKITTKKELDKTLLNPLPPEANFGELVLTEYLPGAEITVDCFSNAEGALIYARPRLRQSIEGGIAVKTSDFNNSQVSEMSTEINSKLRFSGAWFYQAKQNTSGVFKLIEIGARIAGSSGIRRYQGVNLAHMSVLAHKKIEVKTLDQEFDFSVDRGLPASLKEFKPQILYLDFDDTLILNENINQPVFELLKQVFLLGKQIVLISRHAGDLSSKLDKFGLTQYFSEVLHVTDESSKIQYIEKERDAVFIDDSFRERLPFFGSSSVLCLDAASCPEVGNLFV